MKKFLSLILALVLAMTAFSAFADTAAIVEEGAALTHDELVEKALAEEGTFIVYGNTSRIADAAEAFGALYGITCEPNNLKDAEIYTKLDAEATGSVKGADMVMIQDGSNLTYAIEDGILINYVPASVADTLDDADKLPLVHQYINKLFIYNNMGENVPAIKNVWELTDESLKGNVIFKSPADEQVNMNFLTMLTSDTWSEKLAEAYKSWKGEEINLGEYKNAGYKWIAEFLVNCTFGSSDTNIAEEVSQETASGKIGLFVLSKLRSSSVLTDNLTVAQYDASANGYTVEPFAGFMYPIYALVSSAANRPYTAMLFIEYLLTTEGFEPWGKSIGAYSSNTTIPVKEGDLGINVWKDTLVIEDPEYILDNSDEVQTFAAKYLQ